MKQLKMVECLNKNTRKIKKKKKKKTYVGESLKTLFEEMRNEDEKGADDSDGPSGSLRERFLAGGISGGRSSAVNQQKP